jgi:hypothetical protein
VLQEKPKSQPKILFIQIYPSKMEKNLRHSCKQKVMEFVTSIPSSQKMSK